jgi:hypothetical protein
LLAQGAYTERRSTLANDNGITTPTAPVGSGNLVWGKFFPRGCRGYLSALIVYAKNLTGSAGSTVTLSIAPTIGMGAVASIVIPLNTTWNWYSVYVNHIWNYDSMFIWISAFGGSDVTIAWDDSPPFDSYLGGAPWTTAISNRFYVRANFTGETVGDVPVSGTVNNIPIPNTSSQMVQTSISVPAGASPTVISSVNGSGYCDQIIATVATAASCSATIIEVVCDGNIVWGFSFAQLNTFGFTVSTPHVTLSLYGATTQCVLLLTKRFEFKQNLTIQAVNSAGAQSVSVYETVCLIS